MYGEGVIGECLLQNVDFEVHVTLYIVKPFKFYKERIGKFGYKLKKPQILIAIVKTKETLQNFSFKFTRKHRLFDRKVTGDE